MLKISNKTLTRFSREHKMPKDFKREDLVFDDSVKVNKKGEAILGRLYGPVAEFIAPTRNGRMYDEATWDTVFKKPLVKEMFEAGGLLGELNHPEDRLETDLSKVCVCMPEPPKKNKDGCLTATFDILDTPNGRIVETLAKYGYKLGVSSRADGETFEGYDGQEHVDSDSFDLKGFDIVLLPAVKKARLSLAESLSKDFKSALKEQLDKATPDARKIMLESLDSLNIKVDSSSDVTEDDEEAVDDGTDVIEQLQEALKSNRDLEKQVSELQERLSVCYAKEAKIEEELTRYKSSIGVLSEGVRAAKKLKEQNELLTEQLNKRDAIISEKDKKISQLSVAARASVTRKKELTESISTKDSKIQSLQESLDTLARKAESERQSLLENIEEIKKDSEIKTKTYNTKLKKANELVEHYKGVARKAVDRYIESRARMLGVTPQEIKNRLTESYSFGDIDKVCDSMQRYQLNVSKLPFEVGGRGTRVRVTESVEPIKPKTPEFDDEVDDALLQMAGLN